MTVWAAVSYSSLMLMPENCIDTIKTDGFFDAGMLLQALKANQETQSPSERVAGSARRAVGKKLSLSEY